MMNTKFYKSKLTFVILFVYVTLFELVLPSNDFLPKPSILLESVLPLFMDYSFFVHFSITLSILIVGIIAGYILFYLLSKLIKNNISRQKDFEKKNFIRFVPLFILLIGLVKLWTLDDIIYEFSFAVIFILSLLFYDYVAFLESVFPEQYYDIIKNLDMSEIRVLHQIKIKSFLPTVVEEFNSLFPFYLLTIFIFEAIVNQSGIGSVFIHLLENKDLSGFIVLMLIIIMTYLLLKFLFKNAFRKLVYWDGING